MKMLQVKNVLFALALLSITSVFAQKGLVKKAEKDFDRYSFIDAREIYLKVVEEGYASAQIYENLGDTYYWNSDYVKAAVWYEKLMAEFPNDVQTIYYYRAAQTLKSLNKNEESKKLMDLYLENGGDTGISKATSTEFLEYIVQLEKVAVNSDYSDFAPAFYLNNVVYSSSAAGTKGDKIHNWMDQPFTDLFMAKMDENGVLSMSVAVGGEVNTQYHETSPTFSKDGKTMFFTRNKFQDGKKQRDENKTLKLSLYKATNTGTNSWGNIMELPFNSKDYSMAHPALSADGKRLYFSSEMPGGMGMSDIWYVDVMGENSYGEPVNMGSKINTEARESFPFVSDKNNIYFASDGRGGLGGFDVFMASMNEEGAIDKISNLGEPVNSSQDDFGFILNEEKRFGYVSSNRGGEGGSINDDIYLVTEVCEITINGRVIDEDSDDAIPGATVVLNDENGVVLKTIIAGQDGSFSFMVDCEQSYVIRASKELYTPNEQVVVTPSTTSTLDVLLPLKLIDPCPPNDLGCRLSLQPIYFDFDKHNIRPDAAIELAKILVALNTYPQLKIDIESHTDSRGNDSYNESLSERRAQATLQWLINKGIDQNRLSAKGYGEYQHVNNCSNGVKCSEEQHQLNRRSMFLIRN